MSEAKGTIRNVKLDELKPHPRNYRAGMTCIYGLIDPADRQLRYVGKADNPRRRLTDHLRHAKQGRTHKHHWITEVVARGQCPEVVILQAVDRREWQTAERQWIAYFRARGIPLTNGTAGGDGLDNPVSEVRMKMREAAKDRTFSLETRKRMAAAARGQTKNKGRKHSEESRANMSAAHKGTTLTVGHRAKIGAALVGRRCSDATRERIAAAQRKRWVRARTKRESGSPV